MTVQTVTADELEVLAFEHPGTEIHVGKHEADITIDGRMYVARIEGEQP